MYTTALNVDLHLCTFSLSKKQQAYYYLITLSAHSHTYILSSALNCLTIRLSYIYTHRALNVCTLTVNEQCTLLTVAIAVDFKCRINRNSMRKYC